MMQLYTPTDWAAETALRIEYIKWLVETNGLPCIRLVMLDLGVITSDPKRIMEIFRETGHLFVSSEESSVEWKVLSFEEWRGQKATPEERKELARLRSIQKNKTRWFTHEEFDRLNELAHKL